MCAVSVMRTCGCLWCAREGARARGREGAAGVTACSIMAANVFARVFSCARSRRVG